MRLKFIITAVLMMTSLSAFAEINTYVSILPQKYFLEQIGGERIRVSVMVMPGASPATYEPKPKQMVDLSETDIYFAIGVPFENAWLNKFRSLNKKMKIVMTDAGIEKMPIEKHVHDDDKDHHEEHDGIKDPHIWLDPILVAKQAENIADALCVADPAGCDFYTFNKKSFIKKTERIDSEIREILKGHEGEHFMVFHPSWGYFAARYGLHQIPVELEGKEPKPSDLKEFVELTRKLNLKTIFIQPQFARKAVELIAHETGANVVAVDPLAGNWDENIISAAKILAGTF